jgi:O-antigen/teichoic acid export membrane protein
VPIVTGLGALVNVIVNLLLIPILGIMGAALAALASYIVMAAGLYIVTQKFYKIEYENVKMISIFIIVLLAGIIYYLLKSIEALNLFYKCLILIFFLLFASMVVFDKNELLILKNKFMKKLSNK